jgi:FixJ family two-component response regulator
VPATLSSQVRENDYVVHLVDDDPHVLKALARLLTAQGISSETSQSANEFLERYDPAVPGCLVVDMAMPDTSGLDLQRQLMGNEVCLPVVFLSGRANVPDSVRAMKDGAIDFLTKPVDANALLDAVRRGVESDLDARRRNAERSGLQALVDTLTPRERELLPYLVSGKLNKQIAAELGVVEKTIKVHRMHVMRKFGVRRLADLVRMAEKLHVVHFEDDAAMPLAS